MSKLCRYQEGLYGWFLQGKEQLLGAVCLVGMVVVVESKS